MVIGFDGSRAFAKNKTGTENYSFETLKALAKIDRNNRYIVYVRPGSVVLSDSEGSIKDWPINFSFKVINYKRLWTQVGLGLQTFKDNLDVLFVPAHTLPLVRKPGLKTVVTVHDLGSEYLPSMHQIKQRLYLSLMQNYQLKTVTKIIAVSKATKLDLINKLNINEEKIKVVYEGYDKNLFKHVRIDQLEDIITNYNLAFRSYFLFVGTIQPRKNLERLIKAYSIALKSSPFPITAFSDLVLAGSKGWLSDQIYKLPKQLGVEDKVKFLGHVPDKDLPLLYGFAKAFLFPSLFEGFGLPILEAQACGCPVLSSNISSMPEVAGKGAILVNPYSIQDIIKGIERLQEIYTDSGKEYREQLIKLGLQNVKRFSWEKCAKETLKVLEGVL